MFAAIIAGTIAIIGLVGINKAIKKKKSGKSKKTNKKLKNAVQTMSKIPVAVVKRGNDVIAQINNTISPYLYGQTNEQNNSKSR